MKVGEGGEDAERSVGDAFSRSSLRGFWSVIMPWVDDVVGVLSGGLGSWFLGVRVVMGLECWVAKQGDVAPCGGRGGGGGGGGKEE